MKRFTFAFVFFACVLFFAIATPTFGGDDDRLKNFSEETAKADDDPFARLTYYDGTVTRVRGANFVEIDGEKMKLVGVTAPRMWWWGEPRDCYSVESSTFLEELVLDKVVQYAFDPYLGPEKKQGVRKVYLVSEGHLLNADLIEHGQAIADHTTDYLARKRFTDLEELAKIRNKGLWHICPVVCERGTVCRVIKER